MENEKQLDKKKKTTMLVIGLVVVLAAVIAIALSMPKSPKEPSKVTPSNPNASQVEGGEGDMPEGGEGNMDAVDFEEAVNPVLEGAVVNAPGANLVTKDGKVVNEEGKEVRSDVAYNSPEAPRQTLAIDNPDEIKNAVRLTLGDEGFSPTEFSVKAGEAVTIALTSGSTEASHGMVFDDAKLQAVIINLPPNETRAVTFNAPSEKGEYSFYCGIPGHKNRGEIGVMKVQ